MATMLRLLLLSQHLDIVLIRGYGRNPSDVKPQEATTTTTTCIAINKLAIIATTINVSESLKVWANKIDPFSGTWNILSYPVLRHGTNISRAGT